MSFTTGQNKRRSQRVLLQGQTSCPICLIDFTDSDEVILCHTNSGAHKFHKYCLENWFNTSGTNTCPLCRSPCITGEGDSKMSNQEQELVNAFAQAGYPTEMTDAVEFNRDLPSLSLNQPALHVWQWNDICGESRGYWRRMDCEIQGCNNFQWFLTDAEEGDSAALIDIDNDLDNNNWINDEGDYICRSCADGLGPNVYGGRKRKRKSLFKKKRTKTRRRKTRKRKSRFKKRKTKRRKRRKTKRKRK